MNEPDAANHKHREWRKLEYKKIKPIWYVVWVVMAIAIVADFMYMPRENILGLIRLILLPLLTGLWSYMLVYDIFNLISKHMKKGLAFLYAFSQVVLYIVVICMGYMLLEPAKDIIKGSKKMEISRYSFDTSSEADEVKFTSNNNPIPSKYHIVITKGSGENAEKYDLAVDRSTYDEYKNKAKDETTVSGVYFELEYYQHTNVVKKFVDVTDEKLSDIFEDYIGDKSSESTGDTTESSESDTSN